MAESDNVLTKLHDLLVYLVPQLSRFPHERSADILVGFLPPCPCAPANDLPTRMSALLRRALG